MTDLQLPCPRSPRPARGRHRRRHARPLPDRSRRPHLARGAGAGRAVRPGRIPSWRRSQRRAQHRGQDSRASLIGLIGEDDAAHQLRIALKAAGVDDAGLVADRRPTTRKVRVVTLRNQQVARLDYEQDSEASGPALASLCEQVALAAREADVIVLSDYRKGVVSPAVIEAAIGAAAARGVPVLVDPKLPNAERYRGAALVTPNHHEAELMTAMTIRTPDDARRAARQIHDRTGANVLITWGEHGMWLLDASREPFHEEGLAASAREVSDVTGAGDTVLALLALSLAAGASLGDAARLANVAAGLVVARFGPAVVGTSDLAEALGDMAE